VKSADSCKGAGLVVPVIDRNKCEGKEDCVEVCPHDVFRIAVIGDDEKRTMSFLGKLKARAHGNRQAFVDMPDACENCGACVTACPEKAIKLQPR
jgi:NAD-dependent dihydropyrimidine dehydrogenase PreA subunit